MQLITPWNLPHQLQEHLSRVWLTEFDDNNVNRLKDYTEWVNSAPLEKRATVLQNLIKIWIKSPHLPSKDFWDILAIDVSIPFSDKTLSSIELCQIRANLGAEIYSYSSYLFLKKMRAIFAENNPQRKKLGFAASRYSQNFQVRMLDVGLTFDKLIPNDRENASLKNALFKIFCSYPTYIDFFLKCSFDVREKSLKTFKEWLALHPNQNLDSRDSGDSAQIIKKVFSGVNFLAYYTVKGVENTDLQNDLLREIATLDSDDLNVIEDIIYKLTSEEREKVMLRAIQKSGHSIPLKKILRVIGFDCDEIKLQLFHWELPPALQKHLLSISSEEYSYADRKIVKEYIEWVNVMPWNIKEYVLEYLNRAWNEKSYTFTPKQYWNILTIAGVVPFKDDTLSRNELHQMRTILKKETDSQNLYSYLCKVRPVFLITGDEHIRISESDARKKKVSLKALFFSPSSEYRMKFLDLGFKLAFDKFIPNDEENAPLKKALFELLYEYPMGVDLLFESSTIWEVFKKWFVSRSDQSLEGKYIAQIFSQINFLAVYIPHEDLQKAFLEEIDTLQDHDIKFFESQLKCSESLTDNKKKEVLSLVVQKITAAEKSISVQTFKEALSEVNTLNLLSETMLS